MDLITILIIFSFTSFSGRIYDQHSRCYIILCASWTFLHAYLKIIYQEEYICSLNICDGMFVDYRSQLLHGSRIRCYRPAG